MIKQCANCKNSDKPTKRSACNVLTKHELASACKMKYNGAGFSYCDDFRPMRGAKNHG